MYVPQNSAARQGNNPSYNQLSRRFPKGCECHQVGLELNTSRKGFEMIQAGKDRYFQGPPAARCRSKGPVSLKKVQDSDRARKSTWGLSA